MPISDFYFHTAMVSTYGGATPTGDAYADPVPVVGFLDDAQVLANAPGGGQQLVSKTIFYTDLSNADVLLTESLVVCNDRSMQVTQVRRCDGDTLLADVGHLEVDLT